MGIRQKIIVGFAALALLLFFSGMMSYFELNRLSRSTNSMLNASFNNAELSKNMLDGVQDQNTALLLMIIMGRNESNDSLWNEGRLKFDSAINTAQVTIGDLRNLDSIILANNRYNQVVEDHFGGERTEEDTEWFARMYKTSYYELTSVIKNMMLSSQQMIDEKSRQLEGNAYRAIRPGIIALVITIFIIFMFSYLIDIYYVNPVLKVTKGLGNYLMNKVPFKVTFEGRDEVLKLKEYIEAILDELKNKRGEK